MGASTWSTPDGQYTFLRNRTESYSKGERFVLRCGRAIRCPYVATGDVGYCCSPRESSLRIAIDLSVGRAPSWLISKPIETPVRRDDYPRNQQKARCHNLKPASLVHGTGYIAFNVALDLRSSDRWLSLAVMSIQSCSWRPSSPHLPHAGALAITTAAVGLVEILRKLEHDLACLDVANDH